MAWEKVIQVEGTSVDILRNCSSKPGNVIEHSLQGISEILHGETLSEH